MFIVTAHSNISSSHERFHFTNHTLFCLCKQIRHVCLSLFVQIRVLSIMLVSSLQLKHWNLWFIISKTSHSMNHVFGYAKQKKYVIYIFKKPTNLIWLLRIFDKRISNIGLCFTQKMIFRKNICISLKLTIKPLWSERNIPVIILSGTHQYFIFINII